MAERDDLDVEVGGETRRVARLIDDGSDTKPCFVWLGGFRSDMEGGKAIALSDWCQKTGHGCVRFDYSGHGQSGGQFADGCISVWLAETLAVLEAIDTRKLVLVGSSMGGWIALRVAQELRKAGRGDRLHAMVLVAPAPDFATELMEPKFTDEQRELMATQGWFTEVTPYGPDPVLYTSKLIEDGRTQRVLDGELVVGCPVAILQGMEDPDVPWEHAMRLVHTLAQDDVSITLIKDGDHRLSREADIAVLLRLCEDVAEPKHETS
ncbi:MAG: alpha/beta hydrolase [Pseudomonadota bacterium]